MTPESAAVGFLFPWPRFWVPRSAETLFESEAFLWDPEGPFSSGINVGARRLTAVDDRVVVLLGEPGSGKTHSVIDYAADAVNVTVINLPDVVSPEGVRLAVDDALEASPGLLDIVFDGLDEAMIRSSQSDKWLPAAFRSRPAKEMQRLRVRVTCRPAVWPESLATQLAALWHEEKASVLTLAPLRRVDVLSAAEQLGVDGNAFLVRCTSHDILPFAARPVTLRFLLLDFAEGKLPTSKTDVYRSMCARLARELSRGHHEVTLSEPATGPDTLTVAGRLASLSVFTGRPVLWRGVDPRDRQSQELDVNDATRAPDINAGSVQRALNTGLFETAGTDRFRFAHRTYGEFLAAYHGAEVTELSSTDLLALVLEPTSGLVQPQLGEVAAWLAAFRNDIFALLVDRDPVVLLDSDVATRDEGDRERLALALMAGQEHAPGPRLGLAELRRLACSGLVPRLTEVLFGPGHSDRARQAAVDISAAIPDMQPKLVDLVCDDASGPLLRSAAARRLSTALPQAEQRLVDLLAGDNVDDELRGVLLRHLWPATITLGQALAAAVRPPKQNAGRLHTAYAYFLSAILPENVTDTDLQRALEWAATNAAVSEEHGKAADGLLVRGLAVLNGENVSAVARTYLARQRAFGRGRQQVDAALAVVTQDTASRRLFLGAVVAQSETSRAHELAAVRVGLPQDFAWALGQARDEAKTWNERRRWVDVAERWFAPLDHREHLGELWDAADDGNVDLVFHEVLHGVPLGGAAAAGYRARLAEDRQRAEEEQAWLKSRELDIAAVSAALDSDAPDAWMALMRALDPDLTAGMELRVGALATWQHLTQAEQVSATGHARRWVLTQSPPLPTPDGSWSEETVYALRALWLHADDPSVLDHLRPQQWARWAHVLLGIAAVGADTEQRARRDTLLALAHRQAPDAIRAAFRSELDRDADRAQSELAATPTEPGRIPDPLRLRNPFYAHNIAEAVWDESLSEVLFDWQRTRTDDIGLADTVPFLAQHGCASAVDLATSALEDPGSDDISARRRVAGAVALLRCPDPAAHWPPIWRRWRGDSRFGSAVLTHLHVSAGWDLPPGLAVLDAEAMVELYCWLHPRRAGTPTGRTGRIDPPTDVADAILTWLASAGTNEAVIALQRLVEVLPGDTGLPYRLAEAQRKYRADSWLPPSPSDVQRLLDDPRRRLATSDGGLAALVMESLRRAQQRISGETPAVTDLWDHPQDPRRREPKIEPALSDWLKRHLTEDLRSVLVNREVEITPGFRGVRKMREVDLQVSALSSGDGLAAPPRLLRVIIEDKGCWNPNVESDLENQLCNTYLRQTQGQAGIYVVFAFDCVSSGSRRPCPSCKVRSVEQLRSDLERLAESLSTPERLVFSVVLDARLGPH